MAYFTTNFVAVAFSFSLDIIRSANAVGPDPSETSRAKEGTKSAIFAGFRHLSLYQVVFQASIERDSRVLPVKRGI